MPKIAVDAMGGDHAPAVVVEGALLAAQDVDAELILVGDKLAVEQECLRIDGKLPRFQFFPPHKRYLWTNPLALR